MGSTKKENVLFCWNLEQNLSLSMSASHCFFTFFMLTWIGSSPIPSTFFFKFQFLSVSTFSLLQDESILPHSKEGKMLKIIRLKKKKLRNFLSKLVDQTRFLKLILKIFYKFNNHITFYTIN